MALAKHFEEIAERWIANTSARYESPLVELFDRFPSRAAHAGEVYLTRGGRRMEDIEVCEAGQTVEFGVLGTRGTAEPVVEIEDEGRRRECAFNDKGLFRIPFPKPGVQRLHVSSGGYIRPYAIHVIEPVRLGQLPDFAKLIHSLAENPPKWTPQTFERFRSELEAILLNNQVPKLFAAGVLEYHLALFHEEQRLPSFRDRLQAAFGNLRWFTPYSDIARLICTYFLYCANDFEAALLLSQGSHGRLQRASQFFLGQPTKAPDAKTSQDRSVVPLLMSLPDVLSFQAIEALTTDRLDDALELAAITRRNTAANFDTERAARVLLLEAILEQKRHRLGAARGMFEALVHSPWRPIADSASRHLAGIPNG